MIQGMGKRRSQPCGRKTKLVKLGNGEPISRNERMANSAIAQQERQRIPIAAVRSQVNAFMVTPNDPSSATRRTGRDDCNRDAPAGFAAAHG